MSKKIIVLKMDGKYLKVPYNRLGLKQIIQFLEQEEKQLEPAKKGRKMEIPVGVSP